jgi:hypothetical protein
MALIQGIERGQVSRHNRQDPVHRTVYSDFGSGRYRYAQLISYGRADRKHPDKASQVMQFDEQAAAALVKLLAETFPQIKEALT